MTVLELYQYLDARIPRALSCEWDNDGLLCCPDRSRPVRRVLVALDVTDRVVSRAIAEGFDAIVSHHPMIFKGLRAVNGQDAVSAKLLRLLAAGISVMSFHTRLDAVSGGVNDTLASLLGLSDVENFGQNGETIGRIGTIGEPMTVSDFAAHVKETLGSPAVFYGDAGVSVRRVAVLGGSGDDDVSAARAAGADTYLSGTLKYHDLVDAPESGMNLLMAGHFYTERPVCRVLEKLIREADATVACECDLTPTVGAV